MARFCNKCRTLDVYQWHDFDEKESEIERMVYTVGRLMDGVGSVETARLVVDIFRFN